MKCLDDYLGCEDEMHKLEKKIKKLNIDKIHLGWATFKLEFVNIIPHDTEEVLGETNADKRYIKILSGQTDDILKDTLLHEIIHLIHATVGLDDDDVFINEEQRCRLMTQGLLTLFRLNPDIKDILFHEEEI